MGKTFVEKVLGRAAGKPVIAGDVVVVCPDFCMSHENASAVIKSFEKFGVKEIFDPSRLVFIFDHTVPASTDAYANAQRIVREFAKKHGIKNFYDMHSRGGICHQIIVQEGYAYPGAIIVGTDSHTCTHGAMGALSTGIGRTEMAAVWATGDIWLRVPETIKITVNGSFRPGVAAKDLILKIIGDLHADGADYCSVEFHGSALEVMPIADRMTLCNMAVEMGAKNAVCKADDKTYAFPVNGFKSKLIEPLWADADALYCKELEYHLSELLPGVARPHTVDHYARVSEVVGTPIQQAFVGACTNGRIEDLRIVAQILCGKKVAVRTIITPASCLVYEQALKEGIISDLLAAGCVISHPGCGPCAGVMGGILAEGETCIASSNRNFRGRMGNNDSFVYLASPATVAVSALYGYIEDPGKFFSKEGA